MDEAITWGASPGYQTQPLSFVISGLVAFAFLTIPFALLHVYWNHQLSVAATRFSAQFLRGFRTLSCIAWINICLLPAVMMFYPAWTLRLFGIIVMGVYFCVFLYRNWTGRLQVVDPYVVDQMQRAMQDIKPALQKENQGDSKSDKSHLIWAKNAAERLDAMIARLRGKDNASGAG